jgi:hypothetical protein
LQRFIAEDPIGFRGGDVNLYVYARNKATVFADPLGLFELKASVQIGGTNYQLDIVKFIFRQQIDVSKEMVLPPNFGAGFQCKIGEPPSYIDQFSIDLGLFKHGSLGTNFIPNPDFDGSSQSYLSQGFNLNFGWDLYPTGGAISSPQK